MKILEIRNLSKTYHTKTSEIKALEDINFDVNEGEFISIVGPSGCGKSTLLSIIGGLESQTSGTMYMDNSVLLRKNNNIGYMLQKDYLLPYRTVLENVLLGVQIKKMINRATLEYANELLDKYGLSEFKNKYPSQLSGGMRQRVALIRTLATKPDVLLLDEAFSALDYQTRLQVTEDVYQIIQAEKIMTIMVTHDIPEAISMSNEVIVLTKRPSTIKAVYEIIFNMRNRTPLTCRDDAKFSQYFDAIWKALNQ